MKAVFFVLKVLILLTAAFATPAGEAASILLVSNDEATSQSLHDWLVNQGHTVTREQRPDGPGDASGFDLIIVARESNSGDYDDGTEPEDWNALSVPMINMNPYLYRADRWGWMNGSTLQVLGSLSDYDSPFVDPSHPIVLGQGTDFLNPSRTVTGASSSLSQDADVIATLGNGASHGIFIIPSGTALFNDRGIAGDVRMGFIRGDAGAWDSITPNGEQILTNMISWALGFEAHPPAITNNPASSITPLAATVGGIVTDTGGAIPNVIIYYGDNDGGTNAGAWDAGVNVGPQSGAFSAGLYGLTPDTTYYFRGYGTNTAGAAWAASTASFTTAPPSDPPAVVNHPATSIGYVLAELNGEVTDTGGETPDVSIHFGDNDGGTNAANWDDMISLGEEGGTFTREMVGLTDGTTYHYRCRAVNSGGSVWAPATASFTTLAYGPPVVTNTPVSVLTGLSAQVGGRVTDTGGDPPLITIYYGDNDGGTTPGSWDDSITLPQQNSTFSTILSPLLPQTTYYFRCLATNLAGTAWAPSSEMFATTNFSEVFINEFLAANEGTYENYPNPGQVLGRMDDWIEILNVGNSVVDLTGWHLTDKPSDLDQWTFPPGTTLEAGDYLLVYASGDNAPDTNGNLHTNFKLSAGGDYVALVRPDLTVASEFGPGGTDYPGQDPDISHGIHPISTASVFFSIPTPGGPNDAGGLPKVKDTKFSVDRGIYHAPFEVAITTATPGASIYYSTNGNPPIDSNGLPTASATLYTGPVHLARTTVLRAAAVKTGSLPTDIDTHTYLLLDVAGAGPDGLDPAGLNAAVLEQTQPPGFPTLKDADSRTEDDGDYDMDQSVSKSTAQAERLPVGTTRAQALLQGLLDLPTLSIAMDIDDFAGPTEGIYTHADQSGFAWERVCSAELIQGDNSAAWQEDCGIRVQGGASRNRSPKHALSLRFREIYGAGKLRETVFPNTEVEEFNVLTLRAGYNNSWIHWSASQRDGGSMIRDQWARDTLIEMGHADGGQGIMAHVYINGLYWGVHNLCERQDAAHYASYHDGDEDLLDARNAGSWIDGNATAWDAMKSVVASADWSKIQQVIDIDTYIDYQIMNRYGANADLSSGNNWRAAGGGPFPTGEPELMAQWQLYSWDAERILESPTATTTPTDPAGLRGTLDGMLEYRVRFADRLQQHFFHDGALTTDKAQARWMARAAELDRPIIAEAARWGDHRQDVGTANEVYDRNDDWLTEQDRLSSAYFPVRSANVLNRYRDQGLFPTNAEAPVFHINGSPQLGGEIPSGGTLSITAGAGTIYYTLDGSDPRLVGGAVNPVASSAASGAPVTFSSSGLLRARVLNGGEWSPIVEANFFVEALARFGDLAITEIHYHPTPPTLLEKQAAAALIPPQTLAENDFEFVEIQNVSGHTLNLAGVALASSIRCVLSNYVIAAGARAVVVGNRDAFLIRHPGLGALIAGNFRGNLSNDGEQMFLFAFDTTTLAEFTYNDALSWPGRADGNGSSLELKALGLDYNDSESWRPSSEFHGSPGSAGAGPDGRIVINEVLSHTDLPEVDTIELHNTTAAPINITGWYLSDSSDTYRSFRIPSTTIAAGDYVTFDESDFSPTSGDAISGYAGVLATPPTTVSSPGHGLSDGNIITISGYGGIGGYNDTFEIEISNGLTFPIDAPFLDDHPTKGHWVEGRPFALSSSLGETLYLLEADGAGKPVRFVDVVDFAGALNGETLGRWPNGAGRGTLVTMSANTLGASNAPASVGPVILSEVMYHPVSTPENEFEFVEIQNAGTVSENLANWKLRGGVDFDFTATNELAPGALLVVVGFDPATNATATATFRSAYAIDATVALVGPWSDGPLGNDTGTVRLQRPDSPPAEDPTLYPQVTEDEVTYFNVAPWPGSPGGSGDSLHRGGANLFGHFASSWTAGTPTPGDRQLMDYDAYRDITFGPGSPPDSGRLDDFELDGVINILEYAFGMNPKLSDVHLLPVFTVEGDQLTYTYQKNALAADLTVQVQASTNLITWVPLTDTLVSSSAGLETRRASVSMSSAPRMFLRVAISD